MFLGTFWEVFARFFGKFFLVGYFGRLVSYSVG